MQNINALTSLYTVYQKKFDTIPLYIILLSAIFGFEIPQVLIQGNLLLL